MAACPLCGHERGCLGTALHSKLAQDVTHIVLDRLLGEVDSAGDLTISLALGNQSEDAPLLLGQLREFVFVSAAGQTRACAASTVLVTAGSSSDSPRATASIALTNSRPLVCLSR